MHIQNELGILVSCRDAVPIRIEEESARQAASATNKHGKTDWTLKHRENPNRDEQ